MPTATQERTNTVTFVSVSANLRVILKPRREQIIMNAAGQAVAQPPVANEDLPPQQFVRDTVGEGDDAISEEDFAQLPSSVDFKNWTFDTDDPALIKVLRKHPRFGMDVAGFTERYPTAEERLAEVAKLTAHGDVEGLGALLDVERAQGNHASVLEAGEAALSALDTAAEPEGKAKGETAEAGSTDDSQEPPGESGNGA